MKIVSKSTVAILSFSNIGRDSRVLRQLQYLSRHHQVKMIGYGALSHSYLKLAEMWSVNPPASLGKYFFTLLYLSLGRVAPKSAYTAWYWQRKNNREAMKLLLNNDINIIHANEWSALPVAIEAAKKTGAKVVVDLHEYSPLMGEDRLYWRLLYKPMIEFFLKKYLPYVKASITVNEAIAARYKEEYSLEPVVVMNTPVVDDEISLNPTNPKCIHLVHHGSAIRDRKLGLMIRMMKYVDFRYILHFYLVETDRRYLKKLKTLAEKTVPDRIVFHEPMLPVAIITGLTAFDIGVYLLPFTNYNNSVALPNKFFDFIAAGLCVLIGPSLEMARIIEEYGFGIVSSSFNPVEAATILNTLKATDIDQMKKKAVKASENLRADIEMEKLLKLYKELRNTD